MVRGESRAVCGGERTASVEADADSIVRAVSNRHGVGFSESADAELVAAGADADLKCAVMLDSYLAADAAGEPVPRFLVESTGTRLEAGGVGTRHDRSRPRVVRAGVPGDLTFPELFFF